MSDIPETLLEEESPKEVDSGSFLLPLAIALAVVMTALFVGEMLFGKNSLEVYLSLEKNKKTLEKKIYKLKRENASLQKKYFELKNLMPNEEEK